MKVEATADHPLIIIREARSPGAWGKGATPAAAAKGIRQHGARNGATVYVCACTASSYIDEMGALFHDGRGPIYRGKLWNGGVSHLEMHMPAKAEPDA